MIQTTALVSQLKKQPSASFSFNHRSNEDEMSHQQAKIVGANYCEDRFGNSDNAVYLCGHENSYINLGNYPALKPRAGSISLWVKIIRVVPFGKGYKVNPILLTKCAQRDDYFESYAIYYPLDSKRMEGACLSDSSNGPNVCQMQEFSILTWHQLAITYDDDFFSFYVDGENMGTVHKNFETKFDPLDSVMVGVTANKKNNRFTNAIVDDIQFYDTVLSPEEIRSLYNSPDPNKSRLILKWTLLALLCLAGIASIYLLIRYKFSLLLKKEKQQLELANKLLENELRLNRALMSPHFMFNSLNTLYNYILTHELEKAGDYLLKFSKLIRRILDTNMSDTISLEHEIALIEQYLEIESLRFKEHIQYVISKDPGIASGSIIIPIMMLQPFIENAIWHGLRDKTGEKLISISISSHGDKYIQCTIEDNGIGRKHRKPEDPEKKSHATNFVLQRLALLNKIYGLHCALSIIDKKDPQGTLVKIVLPILNKLESYAPSVDHR